MHAQHMQQQCQQSSSSLSFSLRLWCRCIAPSSHFFFSTEQTNSCCSSLTHRKQQNQASPLFFSPLDATSSSLPLEQHNDDDPKPGDHDVPSIFEMP